MTRALNSACPHPDIRWCPLYISMHVAGGPSCDDGRLDEGGCAVDRGVRYEQLLGKLLTVHPRIVAQAEWDQRANESREQRLRNMTLLGIH